MQKEQEISESELETNIKVRELNYMQTAFMAYTENDFLPNTWDPSRAIWSIC